jgi:hypothetical protein
MTGTSGSVGALNEGFMKDSMLEARKGLITTMRKSLFPGFRMYRFANSERPDLYYTGPWWINFSPFEALKQYAKLRGQTLSLAARHCLAIDWGWSKVDVLVEVVIKERLSAWSGTPGTQVLKDDSIRYTGVQWEPDRDITQVYIPGLYEAAPNDSDRMIWECVFDNCKAPTML